MKMCRLFSLQSRHILRLHSCYNRRRQLSIAAETPTPAATASGTNSITAAIEGTNPLPKHTSKMIEELFSIVPNELVVIVIVVIIVVIVRIIVIIVRVVVCVCVMRIVEGITTTSILRGAA